MLDLLIVTGAGRGIGASVVDACAPLSRAVGLIGSSQTVVAKAEEILNSRAVQVDIGNYDQLDGAVSPWITGDSPQTIGIALCAATLGEPGGIFDTELSDWDKIYRTNVLGNISVLKSVVKKMHPASKLRVVFFAGGGAAYGYPEFFGYALSKVATVRAVENLAQEFHSRSLNAAIIALGPGAVATDMLAKVVAHGGSVKTRTDISEPTNFVRRFLMDAMPCLKMSGRFIHVRDAVDAERINTLSEAHFKLRRVE
jgi:3-oxoacyl-[acyl-carrier protein] reductase